MVKISTDEYQQTHQRGAGWLSGTKAVVPCQEVEAPLRRCDELLTSNECEDNFVSCRRSGLKMVKRAVTAWVETQGTSVLSFCMMCREGVIPLGRLDPLGSGGFEVGRNMMGGCREG